MNILWIKDNNAGHEKQAEILLDELSKTREISIHDINIKGFHPFFTYVDPVKESLLKYYQSLDKPLVIEGRDMGSVVFQNAKYKIYLDADLITRGKRREDQSKMNETVFDLKKRDLEDSNRLISPLKVPDGALVINNTDLTLQETINLIIEKLRLQ